MLGESEKNAGILVLSQLLTASTAFLLSILSALVLVPSDRGWLALWTQVAYLLATVGLLGMERYYISSYQRSFRAATAHFIRLIRLGLVAGIAPLAIAAPLGMIYGWDFAITLVLLGLFVLGNIATRAIRLGFIVSRHARVYVISSIGTAALLIAGALTLVQLGAEELVLWQTLYVLGAVVSIAITSGLAFSTPAVWSESRASDSHDLRRGLALLPASLGNTAMLRSDRFVLPAIAGPAALGIYVVVAAASEIASWPIQQWADAKLRGWREGPLARSDLHRVALGAAALAAALSIALGVITAGIVLWILPEPYHAGVALIVPLALGTVSYSVTRVYQGYLVSAGLNATVSASELIGFGVSLLAYLALIPILGAMGAALGSLVGYSSCLVFLLIRIRASSS